MKDLLKVRQRSDKDVRKKKRGWRKIKNYKIEEAYDKIRRRGLGSEDEEDEDTFNVNIARSIFKYGK